MKKNNSTLSKARVAKNDEFYTRYEDISKECTKYFESLVGKIIYCNCDSKESNFYKFFKDYYHNFGLKKLICTCYNPNGYGTLTHFDGIKEKTSLLNGNGSFDSPECVRIMENEDVIVVTNPPFSLFLNFVKLLFEKNKKFLIIGSINELVCTEIFPLVCENKMWMGASKISRYIVPEDFESSSAYIENGVKYTTLGNTCWYTNIEPNLHTFLPLTKKYNETDYPKFDNFDAINVNKTTDIPYDYEGVMGVPVSFVEKHNPMQFEIVGCTGKCFDNFTKDFHYEGTKYGSLVNGKEIYRRIFIKKVYNNLSGKV